MPFNTNLIAQNVAGQTALIGNQATYAQQLSAMHGTAGGGMGFMPTYSSPPTVPAFTGQNMASGLGSMFMGAASAVSAAPYTNQAQSAAGQVTTGMLGMMASPQTPFMGQMFQGLQEQQMVNTALQQSFNFQGTTGRGFSSGQQSQIGGFLQSTANRDIFASLPELTNIMRTGAEMGQFQAVRDVQQFKQRFNSMISSLKEISRTLGTSLEEAQQFSKQMQTMGVFSPGGQVQAARTMGGLSAASGIGMQQLSQFGGQFGNIMNRAVGADRATAAMAGAKTLAGIGAAANQGFISEEQIYSATGQSGLAGRQSLAQSSMAANARFLRRGVGNISVAAFVDPNTGEFNQDRLNSFMSGQIGRKEIGRLAQGNISQMGAAQWKANKGQYRASFMEATGGMGDLALMAGAMPESIKDDPMRSAMWLSRRTGRSMSEVEALMPMIENYPQMMKNLESDRASAKRQQQYRQWASERGPAATGKKIQKRMEQFTTGPFKEFAKNLQSGIEQEIESMVDESFGVYETYLSKQSAQRFRTDLRTGRRSEMSKQLLSLAGTDRSSELLAQADRPASEKFMQDVNKVTSSFQEGGLVAGLGAAKDFVTNKASGYLSSLIGFGIREGAKGLEKIGISTGVTGDISDLQRKIYSGSVTDEDVGLDKGTLTSMSQDKGVQNAISRVLTSDKSEKQTRRDAVAAVKRAKPDLTDDQAEAVVYKAMKENSHLSKMAKNLGAHLPKDFLSASRTADEAYSKSTKLYKEATRGLAFGGEDWKDLRDAMQDETIREAFVQYTRGGESVRQKSLETLQAKMSELDPELYNKWASMSSKQNKTLLYALAEGERAQILKADEEFLESIGDVSDIDSSKFGSASSLMSKIKGQMSYSGEEAGAMSMGVQNQLNAELENIKNPKQLRKLVEDLRKGGQKELADTLERQGKTVLRYKKLSRGKRGQRRLQQTAFMSYAGQHLDKAARNAIMERMRKGKAVTGDMLADYGADLEGKAKEAYEAGVKEYQSVAEGGIDVTEAIDLAKRSTGGLEEMVRGRGEEKKGGALQSEEVTKALGKQGDIYKVLNDIKNKLPEKAPKTPADPGGSGESWISDLFYPTSGG